MAFINSMFNTLKKYKKWLFVIVLVYFIFYFFNIREGFTATSCTQFTNCVECVNGKVIDSSSPCYWSSEKKKCGSFKDPGYSRLCYPGPTPTPLLEMASPA